MRVLVYLYLKGLAASERPVDPKSAPRRSDGSAENPNLQVISGFLCCFCRFLTKSLQTIGCYINKDYQKERLRLKVKTGDLYDDVYLQSWATGKDIDYWIIKKASA